MTDLGTAKMWVKAFMDGLSPKLQDEVRAIVRRRSTSPATGDILNVRIYDYAKDRAATKHMPDDPLLIAEALHKGELSLE